MAILDIVYFPDPPLRDKAAPVEEFGAALESLRDDMLDTMHAYRGVGLAAPQVGISKRAFVLQEPDGEPMCFVNPRIVEAEGKEEGEEGCLSMPTLYTMVPRATRIRVEAQDVAGNPVVIEARDFLARIIQHENDHLDGILFPERVDIITRQNLLEEWADVRDEAIAAANEARAGHAS